MRERQDSHADPTQIEAHQASRVAAATQAHIEHVLRAALAVLDPQADDGQQPYATMLRRLQTALEREIGTAVAPHG
jgi:hypothetical protein